jgi:F0F1-type ATP synthase assembly protein I
MRRLFSQQRLANENSGSRLPAGEEPPAPLRKSGIVGQGQRLVMRVVALQAGCAGLVALLFLALRGSGAALAAMAGGLIVAIGTALFGWRMFLPGIAAASQLQRAMYAGEALKWFWVVLATWAALVRWKLAPLPLICGMFVALFGYVFGLVGMKRG